MTTRLDYSVTIRTGNEPHEILEADEWVQKLATLAEHVGFEVIFEPDRDTSELLQIQREIQLEDMDARELVYNQALQATIDLANILPADHKFDGITELLSNLEEQLRLDGAQLPSEQALFQTPTNEVEPSK